MDKGLPIKNTLKFISKGPSWLLVFNSKTDVWGREFTICDVPGEQFGKPPIFPKGNSLLSNPYYRKDILKNTSYVLILVASIFLSIDYPNESNNFFRNSILLKREFPYVMTSHRES